MSESWYYRQEPGPDAEVTVHRIVDFEVGGDGDGRTLHTRIVPWDTPATVSDPPHFLPYQEQWARGAFDKQLKAANRVDVLMNFEHEQGIGGVVGRGVQLRAEDDGLHGVFRMLSSQDGDKALELVRENILTGLSLEARVFKTDRVDGVAIRQDARLSNVALCRSPAYKDAQVLAVRQENVDSPPAPPGTVSMTRDRIVIPPPLDVERLRNLGLRVPERETPSEEND